jgi:hypothetical protein
MARYRQKPPVIDAEQFLPDANQIPIGVYSSGQGDPRTDSALSWMINTINGPQQIHNGDWVITDSGFKRIMDPATFANTYELEES